MVHEAVRAVGHDPVVVGDLHVAREEDAERVDRPEPEHDTGAREGTADRGPEPAARKIGAGDLLRERGAEHEAGDLQDLEDDIRRIAATAALVPAEAKAFDNHVGQDRPEDECGGEALVKGERLYAQPMSV